MPHSVIIVKLESERAEMVSSKFVHKIGRFNAFLRVTPIVDTCRFRILPSRESIVSGRPESGTCLRATWR